MDKSIFEKAGGTYKEVNGYLIPDLKLTEEKDKRDIGVYGRKRLEYIKNHKHTLYMQLLLSEKLYSYLADINKEAIEMCDRLTRQMAMKHGITQQMKADRQMLWVEETAKRGTISAQTQLSGL